jgi:hypothetical protein
MSHRCYMCNRTDDAAVTLNSSEVYRGNYSPDKRYPILEICDQCNSTILSSLGEMPMLTPRQTIVEPAFTLNTTRTSIHTKMTTRTSIEYDPDLSDSYEDDYEDFDYTNYDKS